MAVVYRAFDRRLNREVALKELRDDLEIRLEDRARFRREAEAAAKLSHPNVVSVLDAGEENGRLFLVMELVEGASLQRLLEREKPSLEILEKAARGVHHAHLAGIVHRDLKPSNILLTGKGEPKISDFGIAHLAGATALTQTGMLLGTPQYMAPEQVLGRTREVGPRTDVYALGAILYEWLADRPVHQAESMAELFGKIANERPVPPREIDPSIPGALETICLKSLEKDPALRTSTAEAFAEDLRRHREGIPIQARPVTVLTRVWRSVVRRRWLAAALAAILLAGAAFGMAASLSAYRRSRQVRMRMELAIRFENEGNYEDAQEAIALILHLDRDNPEAMAALTRVRAKLEVRRKIREEEEKKSAAEKEEADRRRRKCAKVDTILKQWSALEPTLRSFEASQYDPTGPRDRAGESLKALWKAAEGGNTEAAMVRALTGWAEWWSGPSEHIAWQLMGQAAEFDPEIPYGYLMEAFTHLARWSEDPAWPEIAEPCEVVRWEYGNEIDDARKALSKIGPLLKEAMAARIWGNEAGAPYRDAAQGMEALLAGNFTAAELHFDRAVAAPEFVVFRRDFLFALSKVRRVLGKYEEGMTELAEVARVRPRSPQVLCALGMMDLAKARQEILNRGEPIELLNRAFRRFSEALERDSRFTPAELCLGNLQVYRALARGNPPYAAGSLEKAIQRYVSAMKEGWGWATAYHNRGSILLTNHREAALFRARIPAYECGRLYLEWGKLHPSSDGGVIHALAQLERGLQSQPDHFAMRIAAVEARLFLAERALAKGADAVPLCEKAIEDLTRAIAAAPKEAPTVLSTRALAHLRLAQAKAARSIDPISSFQNALADCEEALRLSPRLVAAIANRARTEAGWGRWLSAQGRDFGEQLTSARTSYSEAIQLSPKRGDLLFERAAVSIDLGKVARVPGDTPYSYYDAAVEDLTHALRQARTLESLLLRAEAYFLLTEAPKGRKSTPLQYAADALRDALDAVYLDRKSILAAFLRGRILLQQGALAEAEGLDWPDTYSDAVLSLQEAVKLDPNHWKAHALLGSAHERKKEYAQAAASYRRSLELHPDQPETRTALERVQKAWAKEKQ